MWVQVLFYPPSHWLTASSDVWKLMLPGENFIRSWVWVNTTAAGGF
jgi:hypothetical protein